MNIQIGKKIKELRKARSLTQAQLAEVVGLTTSAISSYEISERQPSYDILIKMASFFNVSVDYILGTTDKDVIDITKLSKKQKRIIREMISEFKDYENEK